ncbi:MAG: hypothetical protein INH37_21135 [Myxococcaceae bacterium]|nr:hypothetical protein [Myxococcaceae bacterium]
MSSRASDTWRKAVVRERPAGTDVEVTPLIRVEETAVEGNGRPLVQFVLGRSAEVDRAVDAAGARRLEQLRP